MIRVMFSLLPSASLMKDLPFGAQPTGPFTAIVENNEQNQRVLEDMTAAALRGDFYEHVDAWEIE